jgi:DmsE family decaheme c-type cytochrome
VLWGAAPSVEAQPAADDAARIARRCNLCHADEFRRLERNPHSALGSSAWQRRTGEPIVCRNCHGDVADHIREGDGRHVFAFREEPALERNERCLTCHRDTHPRFDRSPHALAGLACTSCHREHGPSSATSLLRDPAARIGAENLGASTRTCTDCHSEQLAEFSFNERHRLREGVLECASCHDPHAPSAARLGGVKQQQCLGCHADKGGPFVFEHAASRVEGCTACHSAHGSPNRHMLVHQSVGELCFTCHAAVPQFHGGNPTPRFGLDTQCTNCHTAIHGSNFSPFLLR